MFCELVDIKPGYVKCINCETEIRGTIDRKIKCYGKQIKCPIIDKNLFDFYNALIIEPRIRANFTVITAIDAGYYRHAQCLVASLVLSHRLNNIVIYNLGLEKDQIKWFQKQGCIVQTFDEEKLIVPKERFFWQSWNKPLFIEDAKQFDQRILWLDADCMVIDRIDHMLDNHPIVYRDTASINYNGWEFGNANTMNNPRLYDQYPTPVRIKKGGYPNAGIIGFDFQDPSSPDNKLLDSWIWMIRQTKYNPKLSAPIEIRHQGVHGWLSWHDQGALQWAIEKENLIHIVSGDTRFNDPGYNSESFEDLISKINKDRTAHIIHFPSNAKPYKNIPDLKNLEKYPKNRTDLKILVLNHLPDSIKGYDNKSIQNIDLNLISPDNDLAESRIFTTNILSTIAEEYEYIGLCTWRWDSKYEDKGKNKSIYYIKDLHKLQMRPNRVWAAAPSHHGWLGYTETEHSGMSKIIKHVASRLDINDLESSVPWSNNFIAHRDVVLDLQDFIWSTMGMVRKKFDWAAYNYHVPKKEMSRHGSYLAERLSMLYFTKRTDLEILPVPLKSGEK